MILSVLAMVLTCRRAKRVTASSQVVPILVSLVTVMIYAALLRAPVGTGALAGFALLGTIGGGLAAAMGDLTWREPALVTFLVTASGLALWGVGAAFWGVVAGALALAVQHWRKAH